MKQFYLLIVASMLLSISGYGQILNQAVDYSYNGDGFVTEEKSPQSDGNTMITRYVYPKDIISASGCTINSSSNTILQGYKLLVDKNILNVPIETYTLIKSPSGTEKIISGTLSVFSNIHPWLTAKYALETAVPMTAFTPIYIDNSGCYPVYSTSYVLQETYDSYDKYGNILQKTVNGSSQSSYIFGYKGGYCTAIISNAAANEVAYTSFENLDDKGNWNYPVSGLSTVTPTTAAVSLAGNYCFNLANSGVYSGTLNLNNYIVSYWAQGGGSVSVSGSTSSKSGLTVNGWHYHEHLVTGSGSGVTSISVTGSCLIDELRLYPYDAQMFTYRYIPLVGVAAQCDQKSMFTLYSYDQLNRVEHIYDQYGNITKKFDYRLQQPE